MVLMQKGEKNARNLRADLVDSIQEVLLGHRLSASSDGKHASLSAHRPHVCACGVGAQPGEQLEPDVSLAVHGAGVDLENLGARLQVRQAEFDFPVKPPRAQKCWV